jgi:nucleotidyltransferase/DNA polymerase involved in DNA repair
MTLIASVQIPNLAIAVARRDQPALAEHPLILYAAERQRTLVTAASHDTGVTPGMPLRQAITRCPQAVYQAADPERDRQVCIVLGNLLETFSPRVVFSMAGTDAIVDLDLGRIGIPKAIAVVQRLAQQIHTTLRLVPALGVAAKRFVARRAAAVAGSGSAAVIPPGYELTLLAPQPVTALPIDAEIVQRLHLLGLRTIGALARLPLDALQAQFGASGRLLYQLARGGDDTPIGMTVTPPALVRTARFAGPLSDRTLLEAAIDRLVDRLASQLDAGGWAARAITVTLQLEDDAPWSAERTLGTPTAERNKLKEAFLALSRTAALDTGIEALTLQISALASTVVTQLELFAPASGQAKQLDAALERLGTRYAGSFVRATVANSAAQLPERRVRFEPLDRA